MLRQSIPFGLRFLQNGQEQGCSKLLMNAALFSTRSAAAAGAEAQGAAEVEMNVAQYSSAEAAALAAKKKHLTGLGGLSLKPTGPMGTFAAGKAFSTSSAAASVAVAAPVQEKASFFSKVFKVAAAIAGAVMLALAPTAAADAPTEWQWGFQDMATSTGQAAVDLHHDIMFFVISIAFLVLYMTFQFATKFHYSKAGPISEKLTHHTTLEVLWTVFPTIIVLFIGIPSLTLIYSMDQHNDRPGLTVKVIGRQWYWSYEMHDHLQHKLVDPDRLVAIAEKSLRV